MSFGLESGQDKIKAACICKRLRMSKKYQYQLYQSAKSKICMLCMVVRGGICWQSLKCNYYQILQSNGRSGGARARRW